jgi:hypothetical protein
VNEIYYGAGHTVVGPYHPDEIGARARAQYLLRQPGRQVYEIKASSYEDARRKLAAQKGGVGP